LAGWDQLPAVLSGFGAIPADLGRAIATSAGTVTALFTDPGTGLITAAGALTYRPTQQLRDQVAALLNTCQFPSCRQPAWRCDIDHREPFDRHDPDHGGRTDTANTGPLCRRHHLVKHHTQWRIRPRPERFVIQWISPTGHRYHKRPRPVLLPDPTVTTPATVMAERLDLIAAMAPPGTTPSAVEDLMATLLLQHELNQPRIEYQHDETAWHTTPTTHPGTFDPADDPPPF
jgi:hypothetical protein